MFRAGSQGTRRCTGSTRRSWTPCEFFPARLLEVGGAPWRRRGPSAHSSGPTGRSQQGAAHTRAASGRWGPFEPRRPRGPFQRPVRAWQGPARVLTPLPHTVTHTPHRCPLTHGVAPRSALVCTSRTRTRTHTHPPLSPLRPKGPPRVLLPSCPPPLCQLPLV